MKCPRCRRDNPDGVKFCTGCGLPFTSAHRGSGLGRAAAALLKVVCYVFLMLGVQYVVSTFYCAFALVSDASFLYAYELDFEAMAQRLTELLLENITMLTLVANLITILILSLFFTLRRKNPMEEAMIRPVKAGLIPLCALYGTALNIFISVTLTVLPLPESLYEALNNQYAGLMGQAPLAVEILSTAVVTGILEEVIFRGLALSRLKRGMNRWIAVALSALLFGVVHGVLIAVIYASVMGLILALLSERHRSIVPAMICHIFFNLTSFWFTTENNFVILALYSASAAVLLAGSYALFRRGANEDGAETGEAGE